MWREPARPEAEAVKPRSAAPVAVVDDTGLAGGVHNAATDRAWLELRASGRVMADQYTHALGCGFDTIQIPEDLAHRQDEAQWRGALDAYSGTYQRGYAGRSSILEARRKAAQ